MTPIHLTNKALAFDLDTMKRETILLLTGALIGCADTTPIHETREKRHSIHSIHDMDNNGRSPCFRYPPASYNTNGDEAIWGGNTINKPKPFDSDDIWE